LCIQANIFSRGINEGRQAARQVDTYLMGIGSALPVTGGIVRRPQIESVPKPKSNNARLANDIAHA